MANKKVSVIIPVYNAGEALRECLYSVLSQTWKELDILLIDDGSTDGSGDICDIWAARDPRIRVIHHANTGLSAVRNEGLRETESPLITCVDADDWIEPDYVAVLAGMLEAFPEAGVSACEHLIHRGSRSTPACGDRGLLQLTPREAAHRTLYHRAPDVSVWGKVYRREVLDGLSYPEHQRFEDTWLYAEWLLRAGQIVWTDKPLYHYRVQSTSISHQPDPIRGAEFCRSVAHMTEIILAHFPEETAGCERRQVHAALSVLRLFPKHILPEQEALYQELTSFVRAHGPAVLRDPEAPRRDKIAIRLLLRSPGAYAAVWSLYEKLRR